jgi:hypothetical protein
MHKDRHRGRRQRYDRDRRSPLARPTTKGSEETKVEDRMTSVDTSHLLTLVRPALAPIGYVFAVGPAESVGPLGSGNLAESLRSPDDLFRPMHPLGSGPKAETTKELLRWSDLLSRSLLPFELLERSTLHECFGLLQYAAASAEVDHPAIAHVDPVMGVEQSFYLDVVTRVER